MVDVALLVVGAGSTPCAAVQRAVEAIGRERVLGVVLNRADEALAGGSYYYYHGYYGDSKHTNRSSRILLAIAGSAMSNVLGRRVVGRLLALLLFESALIVGAIALAAWLRLGWYAWVVLTVEQGFAKALFIAVRLPVLPVLRRSVQPASHRRPARAVRACRAGAGRDVVPARGVVLLVPDAGHRPRCVCSPVPCS